MYYRAIFIVMKVEKDDAARVRRTTRRRHRELENTSQRMHLFELWDVATKREDVALARITAERESVARVEAGKALELAQLQSREKSVFYQRISTYIESIDVYRCISTYIDV